MPLTLYVTGFAPGTRAKELAYEFERFGRLVRCDIPAPKSELSRPFAFVEFEDRRDAEDAYHDMHGARFGRDRLNVEWARTSLSANWRQDRFAARPRSTRDYRDRGHRPRDPSPPPRGRSRSRSPIKRPRSRSRSRSPKRYTREDRDRSPKGEARNGVQTRYDDPDADVVED